MVAQNICCVAVEGACTCLTAGAAEPSLSGSSSLAAIGTIRISAGPPAFSHRFSPTFPNRFSYVSVAVNIWLSYTICTHYLAGKILFCIFSCLCTNYLVGKIMFCTLSQSLCTHYLKVIMFFHFLWSLRLKVIMFFIFSGVSVHIT